jgi:glycosyltransferase involved in cell wall biosynthesis
VTIPVWLLLGRLSGAWTVCHVHEAEGTQAPWVRALLYAPLLLANRLVANSEYSLGVYARSWPWLRGRSRVVYNGVPGPEREPSPARASPTPVRLLFMGRISPRKGPDVAIAAVRELVERGVDVQLGLLGAVFPGYQWFEEQLVRQVREAGLEGRVEFYGFQPSIWSRVEDADIVVVPSVVDEPFGNTAVEAMLGQRPLVVSATSGLREASAGFGAVRAVTPGDPLAVADAVQDLLASWPAAREQVAQDRADALRRFAPAAYHRRIAGALSPQDGQ